MLLVIMDQNSRVFRKLWLKLVIKLTEALVQIPKAKSENAEKITVSSEEFHIKDLFKWID